MDDSLREKILKEEKIFKGKALTLFSKVVLLPDGKEAIREYVSYGKGAVAILPLKNEDKVVLIKQFRPSVNEVCIEIPAGKLEKEEDDLLSAAKRELLEETGFVSENFEEVLSFYTTPGFTNEKITIFIAKDLEFVGAKPDEDEHLEIFELSLLETLKFINQGKIKDAKTIIAILLYILRKK